MIVLPRWAGTPAGWSGGAAAPGQWYAYPLGPVVMPGEWTTDAGRVAVYVRCPACSRLMMLSSRVHRIDALGVVSPSLVCPHSGCSWHVFVRLNGWA